MAYTEARKKANRAWDAANLDKITVSMKHGTRARWKGYAERAGVGITAFILAAVEEKAERDGLKEEEEGS